MAKGRRLTTSRSERYLGSGYGYSNGNGHMAGADAAELGEEEIWSMVEGSVAADTNESRSSWGPGTENNSSNGSFPYTGRQSIPSPDRRNMGGLSLAFEDSISLSEKIMPSRIMHNFRGQQTPQFTRHIATSAPVNVPDWSKIYRVDSVESLHDSDDEIDGREMVPPHEYLAREYGGSRKHGGGSVFEGVGRTLKGRDLWRVRDTVWSQTGFDG